VDSFVDTVALDLKPENYRDLLKHGILSTRLTGVSPGIYQIRAFVREPASGLIGTVNNYIEIPSMKGGRMAISSLFLDARYDERGEPVTNVGEGETLAQRRYHRGGQFTYSFIVYNAKAEGKGAQPQLEIRARILKAGTVVYDGSYRALEIIDGSAPDRIITGGRMTLGELSPDEYTLEISVRDKLEKKESRATVRQELDFRVE
jgi:hypothetical protein